MAGTKGRAYITGASSGLGAEFARQLAARGHDLVLIARRVDRLETLAAELRARGVAADVLAADLTRDDEVAAVAARLRADGDLVLLVNNAGFGTRGFLHEADPAGQEAMHRLHVLATMRLLQAALPGMVQRDRGGVINVSSVAAFIQGASNVSYCATKAWMNSFTEGAAIEMRSLGSQVKVQALCPGFTYTEFHDVIRMDRNDIPGPLWLSAEFVVAESLRGWDAGQVIVIPSWKYRALVRLIRVTPWGLVRQVEGRVRKPRR